MIEIEQLKEVAAPDTKYPPCDIRFVTIGFCRLNNGDTFWMADHHKTIVAANREAECYLPGTARIFEIPELPAMG